ncbi:hypothetical protein Fleli_2678 [Bernardetia litoralis DSM 6794]|uniref:Lipoprotein n=1 Tax=Bernardetia litoralis (strain ATCC 23117 / DSM 6794 / NBRC 15988 / NCIMB 1366 / Fx l1 / Sio-4) TaxID=880071 RepID=I4AM50_BERLS|nr:hypothetical protein [Bernardetia litoralis]AFM05035.1 hypothetical protein Fleli_2678 [Bernardetia litoralis DSM 6794]
MNIRNLKFCVLIVVFASLFSCSSNQTKEAESTEVENVDTTTIVVEEVKEEVKEDNELIIYEKSFLGLSSDMKISDYKGTLEKGLLQTGEGDFEKFDVKDKDGNVVAYFVPFEEKVGSITVTSELAKTEDGIKIGDTFGTLLDKYPNLKVYGSEIEGYTQAIVNDELGYRLDEQHYNYELKTSEIKKETKIIEITIK